MLVYTIIETMEIILFFTFVNHSASQDIRKPNNQ